MKLFPNTIMKIQLFGTYCHLAHVDADLNINIAMYRDGERGFVLIAADHPGVFMFGETIHNDWKRCLDSSNCHVVASHVTDPLKLTSRDLRKMARK